MSNFLTITIILSSVGSQVSEHKNFTSALESIQDRYASPPLRFDVPTLAQSEAVITVCPRNANPLSALSFVVCLSRSKVTKAVLIESMGGLQIVGVTRAGETVFFESQRNYESKQFGQFIIVDVNLKVRFHRAELENSEVDFALIRALGVDRYKNATIVANRPVSGGWQILANIEGAWFNFETKFSFAESHRLQGNDSLTLVSYDGETRQFQLFSRTPHSWTLTVLSSGAEQTKFSRVGDSIEVVASSNGNAILTIPDGENCHLLRKSGGSSVIEFLKREPEVHEYGFPLIMSSDGSSFVFQTWDRELFLFGKGGKLQLGAFPEDIVPNFVSNDRQVFWLKDQSLYVGECNGNVLTTAVVLSLGG